MWEKAIELDPLEAQFYLSLAETKYREGEEEEGKRLARLALEIDEEVVSWGFQSSLLKELAEEREGADGP